MNIVVTGAAGYIGSTLCKMLLDAFPCAKIIAFDNCLYNQDPAFMFAEHDRLLFYKRDVLDLNYKHVKAFEQADYVIPLAAIVGAPACDKNPEMAEAINFRWYFDLLDMISDKTRIIYPNTNSGYGTTPEGQITTEESPVNPLSLYGETKQSSEDLLLNTHPETVVFRLATVFGLSLRPRLDLLVNNFVYRAIKDKHIEIFDGHYRRNFVSVKDVCRAFIFAMKNFELMKGQVYNLGTDSLNATKLEFGKQISSLLNCTISEGKTGVDPDKRDYNVSSKKLYSVGYSPMDTTLGPSVLELAAFLMGYRMYNSLEDTKSMFNY